MERRPGFGVLKQLEPSAAGQKASAGFLNLFPSLPALLLPANSLQINVSSAFRQAGAAGRGTGRRMGRAGGRSTKPRASFASHVKN